MPDSRKFSDFHPAQRNQVITLLAQTLLYECSKLENDDSESQNTPTSTSRESVAALFHLFDAGIKVEILAWTPNGKSDAERLGSETSPEPDALTVEDTTRTILDIIKYISLRSEAGCEVLINAILMHIVLTLDTPTSTVSIVGESQSTDGTTASEHSYDPGVVNQIRVSPSDNRRVLLESQVGHFHSLETAQLYIKCAIYEACHEAFCDYTIRLPKAAMSAVLQARRLQFQTFRGCVTSGTHWLFFIYNQSSPTPTDGNSPRGVVSFLPPIEIGNTLLDLTAGLPLVLGMLRDWIEHGRDKDLRFLTYT